MSHSTDGAPASCTTQSRLAALQPLLYGDRAAAWPAEDKIVQKYQALAECLSAPDVTLFLGWDRCCLAWKHVYSWNQRSSLHLSNCCRLVRPMLARAERIAPDMTTFALATTISALGRLKLQPPGLMDALLAAAEPLVPSFDAKVQHLLLL